MKNINQATHNHKRVGAVVVLRSTAELAEVLVPVQPRSLLGEEIRLNGVGR